MQSRFFQLLIAELLALGAFVATGVACLGAAVTWTGDSRHPAVLSWALVVLFTGAALLLGRTSAVRLRRVFARTEPAER